MKLFIRKCIIAIVIFQAFSPVSFGQALPKTGDSIQITQLKDIIISLQQAKKSFKNFSLSSSSDDQISLNYEGKKFEISYRPEKQDMDLWLPKFQDFAMMNGREIKITETTDARKSKNGKPLSDTNLTMKEKDPEAVYELIRGIMLSIFRNGKNKYYQLIMPE